MAFYKKRDHVEVMTDILSVCMIPRSITYVRRQTHLSYPVLQACLKQLVAREWLKVLDAPTGQPKLSITSKGSVLLKKYIELQMLIGSPKQRPIIDESPNEILCSQVAR